MWLADAQATHEDYANKLYATPSVSSSKRFSKPKLSRTDFTVDHYAGVWRGGVESRHEGPEGFDTGRASKAAGLHCCWVAVICPIPV